MRLPDPRNRLPNSRRPAAAPETPPARLTQSDKDLLIKGILCVVIGAVVLIAPGFLSNPATRDMVAQAAVVGWFAVVLGCAFIGLHLRRRTQAGRRP